VKSISFAWTTDALLAGRKTSTLRQWKDTYAQQFKAGELVTAYDKQARFGGRPVAIIRLTHAPTKGDINQILDDVYEAEGFAWYDEQSAQGSLVGQKLRAELGVAKDQTIREWLAGGALWGDWVIRFELVEVLS
jgi:hypothetical protein